MESIPHSSLLTPNLEDKIFLQDCLVGMQRIPDQSIDMILCDLPYGTTANAWDSVIPLDQLWPIYKRIIKPEGAIVLFAQTPFDKVLGASNLPMLKYEWIWQKTYGTGFLNANCAPLKHHENILVFSHSNAAPTGQRMTYHPQMGKGKPYEVRRSSVGRNYHRAGDNTSRSNGERYPTDVLTFKADAKREHPTQKPVDLLRYLIRTYTNPGDLVLDNCLGSGSTCVAAIREGRHYIGFETDPEYFRIAQRRIAAEGENIIFPAD